LRSGLPGNKDIIRTDGSSFAFKLSSDYCCFGCGAPIKIKNIQWEEKLLKGFLGATLLSTFFNPVFKLEKGDNRNCNVPVAGVF